MKLPIFALTGLNQNLFEISIGVEKYVLLVFSETLLFGDRKLRVHYPSVRNDRKETERSKTSVFVFNAITQSMYLYYKKCNERLESSMDTIKTIGQLLTRREIREIEGRFSRRSRSVHGHNLPNRTSLGCTSSCEESMQN